MTEENTEENRATLKPGEYHPAANDAIAYVLMFYQKHPEVLEGLSSCAIENNRLAEICSETLRRVISGEPVSDRYLLGLAWTLRMMQEVKQQRTLSLGHGSARAWTITMRDKTKTTIYGETFLAALEGTSVETDDIVDVDVKLEEEKTK